MNNPVTLDDKTAVEAARIAYNGLTNVQQALVINLQELTYAEATIQTLEQEKADQEAAQSVMNQIAALNVKSTNDEAAVVAARSAYTDLTESQKLLVTNLDKLTNAENTLAQLIAKEQDDKAAAKIVQDQIDALNVQSITDEAAVQAARTAYANLTVDQRAWVTNLAKLQDAEATIAQLKLEAEQKALADQAAANAVIGQIAALDVQSVSDEAAVLAARESYKQLTDTQKRLVTNLTKLQDAEATIAQLKLEAEQKALADQAAANAVIGQIAALNVQSLSDKDAVDEAREAYEALSDAQKALVINLETLQNAEAEIARLKIAQEEQNEADKDAAQEVINLIADLNVQSLSDKDAVDEARNAYEALSDAQKALVINLTKLEDAEATLTQLKKEAEEKAKADQAAADTVIRQIAALNVQSLSDETIVVTARNAYNHLTDDQKALVTNLAALEAAETKIAELKEEANRKEQDDKNKAEAVQTLIADLNVQSLSDKDAVDEARNAYEALSDAQKALVINFSKLLDAEAHIKALIVYGDTDGDHKVTAVDALNVLKGVVGKITLTKEQLICADTDGNGKADATDALNILKKVVGKLEQFPVEQ